VYEVYIRQRAYRPQSKTLGLDNNVVGRLESGQLSFGTHLAAGLDPRYGLGKQEVNSKARVQFDGFLWLSFVAVACNPHIPKRL
jgi:hypothetical protein